MKLSLYRTSSTLLSTQGKLFGDGAFLAYTLELPMKDGLPGSAIPAGEYPIELAPSPKFQALAEQDPWWKTYCDAMPHVICPPRSLIMIHVGNLPSETDGCILVGEVRGINQISTSRPAFARLYPLIQMAMPDVSITISDPPGQPAGLVPDLSE